MRGRLGWSVPLSLVGLVGAFLVFNGGVVGKPDRGARTPPPALRPTPVETPPSTATPRHGTIIVGPARAAPGCLLQAISAARGSRLRAFGSWPCGAFHDGTFQHGGILVRAHRHAREVKLLDASGRVIRRFDGPPEDLVSVDAPPIPTVVADDGTFAVCFAGDRKAAFTWLYRPVGPPTTHPGCPLAYGDGLAWYAPTVESLPYGEIIADGGGAVSDGAGRLIARIPLAEDGLTHWTPVSTDGRRMVALAWIGDAGGAVRLLGGGFDRTTGPADGWPLQLSVSSDGTASAGRFGQFNTWLARDEGPYAFRPVDRGGRAYVAAQIAPDGRFVAATTADGLLTVFERPLLREVRSVPIPAGYDVVGWIG